MSEPHLVLAWPGEVETDPLLRGITPHLRDGGCRVSVFGLPTRLEFPQLCDRLRTELAKLPPPFALGGFSLGARVALDVSADSAASSLVCLGLAFHDKGRPEALMALPGLMASTLPTLVVQGSRDPYGDRARVSSYVLPSCVELHWLEDGNHRFVPREKSGRTAEEHYRESAAVILRFLIGPLH